MTLNFWRRSLTMALAVTDLEIWKHKSLDSRSRNVISCRLDMFSNHLRQAAREHTGLQADSYVNNFPTTLSFKLGAKLIEKYAWFSLSFFVLCDVLFLKNQSSEITISRIQTHTQCTRLHTGSLGPQPQHLVLNTICSSIQPALLMRGRKK